jgi:putative transposase
MSIRARVGRKPRRGVPPIRLTDSGLPPLPCAGRHSFSPSIYLESAGLTCWCGISNRSGRLVKCTRANRPFHIDAWVVLPDHMHCVITLPPGDDDFSNRIKAMKSRFVHYGRRTGTNGEGNVASGDDVSGAYYSGQGRSCAPYALHALQPGKHGYVSVVAHWPHSTFHRWVKAGAYPRDGVARVRWMLLAASVADNVVTCHSAEHPCVASALRGLESHRALQARRCVRLAEARWERLAKATPMHTTTRE